MMCFSLVKGYRYMAFPYIELICPTIERKGTITTS